MSHEGAVCVCVCRNSFQEVASYFLQAHQHKPVRRRGSACFVDCGVGVDCEGFWWVSTSRNERGGGGGFEDNHIIRTSRDESHHKPCQLDWGFLLTHICTLCSSQSEPMIRGLSLLHF